METPEAINEQERLKQRVRLLERALADANIELALERQFTRLACERAGIKDVADSESRHSQAAMARDPVQGQARNYIR